ncbi:MAG: ROK family transcriptional regulator [Deltaproteobacteria bacterium]|nr:ROK family transcriptional regulator [Deltaproteobacteria bacterium]
MMAKNSKTNDILTRETKISILNAIRENEGISRLEIAEKTHLSTATVTRVVESLININDLVEERGSKIPPKGRPRKLLYFKGHDKYIIGLDIGTTYIRGVLSDLNMDARKEIDIITEAHRGYEHVISRIVDVIERLQNTNLVDRNKIKGIGIAIPGMIDAARDLVIYSPAFNWHEVKVNEILKTKISLPVYYDNVSRVMALGELNFGKGRNFDNFIIINVGYGIGAGIIIHKKLFYGTNGMAGEFGHVPVCGDNIVKCTCGKTNCLTAYSSGDAIAKRVKIAIENGTKSKVTELVENNNDLITAEIVAKAAQMGDELSARVFKESMRYLGESVAGLIKMLNPQAVFFGGGVSLNGEIFWDNLRKTINKNMIPEKSAECGIYPVTYPGKSAVYGSLALVLKEILNFKLQ